MPVEVSAQFGRAALDIGKSEAEKHPQPTSRCATEAAPHVPRHVLMLGGLSDFAFTKLSEFRHALEGLGAIVRYALKIYRTKFLPDTDLRGMYLHLAAFNRAQNAVCTQRT